MNSSIDEQEAILEHPLSVTARGTSLFTHGLNQNPDALESMRLHLRELGFRSYQLRFSGHRTARNNTVASNSEWLSQLSLARQRISSEFPQDPIINISYSLGAAVTVKLLDSNPDIHFDRLVLLAPALALTRKTALIKAATMLRFLNISIPSFAPKAYRALPYLPLSTYHASFSLIAEIASLNNPIKLNSIPSLIILNKKDPLISCTGVHHWLQHNGLTRWQVQTLDAHPEVKGYPAHLMVDQSSLGKSAWQQLKSEISQFLLSSPPPPTISC